MEDLKEQLSVFRGTYINTIDSKGRVNIPSTYRQVLSEQILRTKASSKGREKQQNSIVVTNYITEGARCLEAYTLSEWEVFENRLRSKSRFDPKIRALEHYYFSRAAVCNLDSNGRINIPQNLRAYASLEKEILFCASFNGFRIWDKRIADMVFENAEAQLLENPELFRNVDV